MTKQAELTARQREVYDFIFRFIGNNGWPPTIREIGDEFGITSPNGVLCHLQALEAKGYLRRTPGISRGLTVLA